MMKPAMAGLGALAAAVAGAFLFSSSSGSFPVSSTACAPSGTNALYSQIVTVFPQSNDRENLIAPKDGRMVWQASADGAGILLTQLAAGTERGVRVVDDSALRGQKVVKLGVGAYAVRVDTPVKFLADGTFYVAGSDVTGTAWIESAGEEMRKVDLDWSHNMNGFATVAQMSKTLWRVVLHADRNLIMDPGTATTRVARVTAYGVDPYYVSVTNDLVATLFPTIDTLGSGDLGHWREWAYHAHDGNLGEDWASHVASSDVRLSGRTVNYTADEAVRVVADVSANGTNDVSWYAGPNRVMTVFIKPGSSAGNGSAVLKIVAYERTQTNQTFYVYTTASGVVKMLAASSLDGTYGEITTTSAGTVSVAGYPCQVLRVSGVPSGMAFYKASVTTGGSAAFGLKVSAGAFYMDGDDGKTYRLSVSNATLIVKEVTL